MKRHDSTIRALEIGDTDTDMDLRRAMNLMDLHVGIKQKYSGGLDEALLSARNDVDGVLQESKEKERQLQQWR